MPQAEAAFKRAIKFYEPENLGRAYMHLGALYYNAERFRNACQAYTHAVQFDPENSEAVFFLALSNERLSNYASAVQGYRRYLRLTGQNSGQKKRRDTARERIRTLEPLLPSAP